MNYLPIILCILLSFSGYAKGVSAQEMMGFDPSYRLLHSGSYVKDKNFYLFTLLEQLPEARAVIESDEVLSTTNIARNNSIEEATDSCWSEINCWIDAYAISKEDQQKIGQRLYELAQEEPAMQSLVHQHLRPSGMYIKFATMNDPEFLRSAWEEACAGMQTIYDIYALGVNIRYPIIDAAYMDVDSSDYKAILIQIGFSISNNLEAMSMPHESALAFALWLLKINNRDEAGRYEPLESEVNKAVLDYIPNIEWDDYPYAVIFAGGAAPLVDGRPLSGLSKLIVKEIADRFHREWAPLIIVSGGNVHPNQTLFTEAIEMKKALIEDYGVPERAIVIEPHARHTPTNFRNAARLMFRYGIPTEKLSVNTTLHGPVSTDPDPNLKRFDERNLRELGYLPYQKLSRISANDITFKPSVLSMHADPRDPLDP